MGKEAKKNSNWLLWVLLVIFPPAGIPYMWIAKKELPSSKKKILSVVSAIWFVIVLVFGGGAADPSVTSDDASVVLENVNEKDKPATSTDANETIDRTPKPDTTLDNAEQSDLTESKKYTSISQIKLDELQQLYLDFDPSMSYSDALEYIQSTGLPYSEEKYNGSRVFQIALTDGCTVQQYMKESGPYITISYEYAEGENSINDDKAKYSFGTCVYNIDDFSLIVHNMGYYFDISASGTYISKNGNTLDELTNLSKEDQLLYYFNDR